METIKNIAAIIGCILSLISLITLCTKGGRAFIKSIFESNTKWLPALAAFLLFVGLLRTR